MKIKKYYWREYKKCFKSCLLLLNDCVGDTLESVNEIYENVLSILSKIIVGFVSVIFSPLIGLYHLYDYNKQIKTWRNNQLNFVSDLDSNICLYSTDKPLDRYKRKCIIINTRCNSIRYPEKNDCKEELLTKLLKTYNKEIS